MAGSLFVTDQNVVHFGGHQGVIGGQDRATGQTENVLDAEFFERAEMEDTKVGSSKKDDPADVARTGYDAMMSGERSVVYGLKNKLQVAASKVLGGGVSAAMHRSMAEPGSAD